ncbi:AraD1 family protein [Bradyrhizobium sp. CB3481]|uniref:AraD1 family protein n=1 Tax=Bradyrhizobium sp. CB3481 TaxID=3039158 RepID=UPI0024B237CF|nr:AraD1 family protein [Bradyrhizobium sp. CB3481]WFU14589.1 GguC family protein [Bradyrhizobium sp. CB3481]
MGVIKEGDGPRRLNGLATTRELALEAHRHRMGVEALVDQLGVGATIAYDRIISEKRLLVPLDHPDPAHCVLAITGLTHLGSAKSRDAMHAKLQVDDPSDSLKMFKLGIDGGKPLSGTIGAQPEWAYKGDGAWIVHPEQKVSIPCYADDMGEEAEIVGLYVIADNGDVLRLGFALGNEFSDHVMERKNYLYLAHSKLRQCSFGPELRVGDLPASIEGKVSISRGATEIWGASFLTGESEMCHSIANLEHHHFKYRPFRRPGDVHVYFLGADVLSFGDCKILSGDVTEVSGPGFGTPLRNILISDQTTPEVIVTQL